MPPAVGEADVVSVHCAGVGVGVGVGVGMTVKVAVTVLALVIVTVQTLPLTELQPDQLLNW